jgi:hypothetical protein
MGNSIKHTFRPINRHGVWGRLFPLRGGGGQGLEPRTGANGGGRSWKPFDSRRSALADNAKDVKSESEASRELSPILHHQFFYKMYLNRSIWTKSHNTCVWLQAYAKPDLKLDYKSAFDLD